MEITKKDVLDTAELLNIALSEGEVQSLTESFANLINYFSVLNETVADIDDTEYCDDISRTREDEVVSYPKSGVIIARCEEYEDNFVVIPNVL